MSSRETGTAGRGRCASSRGTCSTGARAARRRRLARQFTAALAGWEWDLALLQEVPPWWPAALARRTGAEQRTALTSRNAALAVRRALAARRPERSSPTGAAPTRSSAARPVAEHRALRSAAARATRAQLLRLDDGTAVANFHGSARVELAEDELARLWRERSRGPAGAPLVLGGDLNLRDPRAPAADIRTWPSATSITCLLSAWSPTGRPSCSTGASCSATERSSCLTTCRCVSASAGTQTTGRTALKLRLDTVRR